MASGLVFGGAFDERSTFKPDDPAKFAAARRKLAGKRVEVVLRRPRSKRSLDQNAWWWGVAVPMVAESLGYDRHEHDQVHYALVSKCFGVRQDPRLGEVPNVRSSQLSVEQFAQLMEWAVRWAATELGCVLPLPGDTE